MLSAKGLPLKACCQPTVAGDLGGSRKLELCRGVDTTAEVCSLNESWPCCRGECRLAMESLRARLGSLVFSKSAAASEVSRYLSGGSPAKLALIMVAEV